MSVLEKDMTLEKMGVAVADFSEATVRSLSAARQEPEWMLELRLEAWRTFEALPWPKATDEAWRRTRLTGFDLKKFAPVVLDGNHKTAVNEVIPAGTGRYVLGRQLGFSRWRGDQSRWQRRRWLHKA